MWWIPPMYGAEGSTNLRSGDPDGSPGEGEALDPRPAGGIGRPHHDQEKALKKKLAAVASVLGLGVAITMAATSPSNGLGATAHQIRTDSVLRFQLQRSTAVTTAGCLAGASASVSVKEAGQVEHMTINAHDLVPNSEYDVFIIQVPDAPFGLSWYQGDMESDQYGNATGKFVGRFNTETFSVAPDVAQAPVVHEGDASQNPKTAPVHQFHVGIWFGSPATAVKAGCPNTVTPFNGDHTAGIQALSTTQFDDLNGPLRQLG
jgi:hypothetical protein